MINLKFTATAILSLGIFGSGFVFAQESTETGQKKEKPSAPPPTEVVEKRYVRASEWEAEASQWALKKQKESIAAHAEEYAKIRSELQKETVPLTEELHKKHQKNGFVVFRQAVGSSMPRREAPSSELVKGSQWKIGVAGDEWEEVLVGIWAMQDLKNVTVKVNDLIHSDGKSRLSKDNIRSLCAYNLLIPHFKKDRSAADGDVNANLTKKERDAKSKVMTGWKEVPGALMDLPSIDVEKDTAQTFWVDVYAPPQTRGGTYRGEIELMIDGSVATRLPLEVEVYPFTLDWAKDWGRGAFIPKTRTRAELVQMREHGLNMISLWWDQKEASVEFKDGKMVCDFSPYQNYLKLLDEVGYNGPHMIFMSGSNPRLQNTVLMALKRDSVKDARNKTAGGNFEKVDLSAPFEEHYIEIVRQIHEQVKAVGHGKMGICVLDEPDHEPRPQRRDFYLKVYAMVEKALPHVPYYGVFYHEGDEDRLSHHHTYWCTNRAAKKIADMCKEAGKQIWTYGFGFDYHANYDRRFQFGFIPWVFDATGSYFWANFEGDGNPFDPWNLLVKPTSTVSLPTPIGPISSPGLKAARKNVDDGRYARMLSAMVKQAMTMDEKAKEEAKIHDQFLKSLKDTLYAKLEVSGGSPKFASVDGLEVKALDGTSMKISSDTNAFEFSEFLRNDMAKRIIALQAKMK